MKQALLRESELKVAKAVERAEELKKKKIEVKEQK